MAEAFGDTLAFDEGEWQKIIDFFARTNRRPTPNNRKQAMCPTKGHKLINDHGTAPGAWFEDEQGRCSDDGQHDKNSLHAPEARDARRSPARYPTAWGPGAPVQN